MIEENFTFQTVNPQPFNPSSPEIVLAPVLKNAQPMDKIAPSAFKLILSPHFSETKFEPTTFPGGRVNFQN